MADAMEMGLDVRNRRGRFKKMMTGLLLVLLPGSIAMTAGYYLAGGKVGRSAGTGQPELVAKDAGGMTLVKGNKQPPKFAENAFKITYYPIDGPFTSNLKNSNDFVQVSISIATYYDERVLENIKAHETPIRSAILMALAEQDTESLNTQNGKKQLQGILTKVINKVLKEKTGFGGVNNIYFTSFVVQ
ncbi:flagellar basal body-associated FliL family protein [Parasphingorhabdus sp.]|uniref:flagellar basal body-associated FliL family protein n=1 Tax=Parasphingorhabdus sp. TaxID=2709688 RepID=UPI003BAF6F88